MSLKLVFRRKFNFISRFFCYAPDLVMFQNAWVLLTGCGVHASAFKPV